MRNLQSIMKTLKIASVSRGKTLRDFIAFPKKLYAGNGQYVPDLDSDVRDVFNPKKNRGLEFSEVEGFVAYRGEEPVGRVMAIVNHHANEKWKVRVVRFGYLDFIDDAEVSQALLDKVAEWGRERGMDSIQGPLGITDYDKEGMLMSDFGLLGSMATYYNYPYYPKHMEALGYTKAVDWLSIRIAIPKELPKKYVHVAKLSAEMFDLKVRTLTKKEIKNGYIHKIFGLLNSAFSAPLRLLGVQSCPGGGIHEYVSPLCRHPHDSRCGECTGRDGGCGCHHRQSVACPPPCQGPSAALGLAVAADIAEVEA